jgi:hypothetical protein
MYREVTMIEIREVLRLRGEGLPKKRIAAQLGLDPKTVRRYLSVAATAGVGVTPTVSDEDVRQVLLALHPAGGRPRGDGWTRCVAQRAAIERWLGDGLRLTKIRKLLVRQGVEIAYPTLHRFAVLELQFGKTATTIPVLDGEPGQELQLDTGWVGRLTLPERKWRRFRAWIFTAVRSRHRFVYPTFEETTARAIEACEAAWEFFGGIFKVLIPDNTKAIVITADPLMPRITPGFLEYAQARHFHIDPARVRQLVRFYARRLLIKAHPRKPPGGQSIDASDYPVERSVYAMRNVDALRRQADTAGEVIGRYAAALLDSPLPWTRMRRVYALLGLVRRYGAARVTEVCTIALGADLLDVHRLKRMLELGLTTPAPVPPARVLPLARYLRPATQYQLPLPSAASEGDESS